MTKNKFLKDGIVLLNKSKGLSSFRAVNNLKYKINPEKAGHGGTLDPMAEGLLIVMINGATKFSESLMKKDKKYYVEFELGYETDTYDAEGKIVNKYDGEINIGENEIKNIVNSFVGNIEQIPPMYSAIKMDGQKLYELARKGVEVERKARKVKINSITEIKINKENSLKVSFYADVSSGTYIRSLVKDIGNKLGVYATMIKLVRTQIDRYELKDSVDMEVIEKINENEGFDEIEKIIKFKDIENIFDYESLTVKTEKYEKLKNGMTVLFKMSKFKEVDKITENKKYKLYLKNEISREKEFKGVIKVIKKGTNMIYMKRDKYYL